MYFSLLLPRDNRVAGSIVILVTSFRHSLEDRQRSQMQKTDIYCRNLQIEKERRSAVRSARLYTAPPDAEFRF